MENHFDVRHLHPRSCPLWRRASKISAASCSCGLPCSYTTGPSIRQMMHDRASGDAPAARYLILVSAEIDTILMILHEINIHNNPLYHMGEGAHLSPSGRFTFLRFALRGRVRDFPEEMK